MGILVTFNVHLKLMWVSSLTAYQKNKEIPREAYPEARELQHQFEGTKDEVPHIRNICLHEEEVEYTKPIRTFDTNSVLVFPRSFAAFRTHF